MVLTFGFLFEIFGLGIAARGLWETWRSNAGDRRMLPDRVHAAGRWFRRRVLHRKPRTVQGNGNLRLPAPVVQASGTVTKGLRDDMDIEAKIAVVQENALQGVRIASEAGAAIREETRERKEADEALANRHHHAKETTRSYAQRLVVGGIPKAVGGLAFAAVGLLLQAIASVATFNS